MTVSSRALLAILLAVVVVGSGAGYLVYLSISGGGEPVSISDGPTFYQAVAAIQPGVLAFSGGPWTLFSVYGIASPLPFTANGMGPYNNSETINSCGSAFNGLTIWNGSIPRFSGTFNSGTAPFWQLAYFSNSTQSLLITTDVLGRVTLFPPIGLNSTCGQASELGLDPAGWASSDFVPFPADSTVMASAAWAAVGKQWTAVNPGSAELYVLGANRYNDWPAGLLVAYERCGVVGAAGVQPVVYADMNSDGSLNNYFNGTKACTAEYSPTGPPIPNALNFSAARVARVDGTLTANQSFVASVIFTPTSRSDDALGLVTWMASLSLLNRTGSLLPTATPVCRLWTSSASACSANPAGWYVVLLSQSGSWLDTYPGSAGLSNWTIPNQSITTNQSMLLVCPSTWAIGGDMLTVASTTAQVILGGEATFPSG